MPVVMRPRRQVATRRGAGASSASNNTAAAATPSGTPARAIYRRWPKPPYSYRGLIATAIMSEPCGMATLAGIYGKLTEWFPFFSSDYKGWKDSVRHNLSNTSCFMKVLRDPGKATGKSNYWTVEVEDVEDIFLRRQETDVSKTGNYALYLHEYLGIPSIWDLSKMTLKERRSALLGTRVSSSETKEEDQESAIVVKVTGRKRRSTKVKREAESTGKKKRNADFDVCPGIPKAGMEDLVCARNMDTHERASSSEGSDVKEDQREVMASSDVKEDTVITDWLLANADKFVNTAEENDQNSGTVLQTATNLHTLSDTAPGEKEPHLTELKTVTVLPPIVSCQNEDIPRLTPSNAEEQRFSWTASLFTAHVLPGHDSTGSFTNTPGANILEPIFVEIPAESSSYLPLNPQEPSLMIASQKPGLQVAPQCGELQTNFNHQLPAMNPENGNLHLLANVALGMHKRTNLG